MEIFWSQILSAFPIQRNREHRLGKTVAGRKNSEGATQRLLLLRFGALRTSCICK